MDDEDAKKPWPAEGCSILIRLVSRSVFDTSTLKLRLDVFRDATLDSHSVHASYVLGWVESVNDGRKVRDASDIHVLCQRATQLDSGSMTAMIPSKYVVVQTAMRSGDPFICGQGNSLGGRHRILFDGHAPA